MNRFIFIIFGVFLFTQSACSNALLEDNFVNETLSKVEVIAPETNLEYNYLNTDCVKIPIRITQTITTKKHNKAYEGQKLEFITDTDVYYKNELIVKKGTIVTARIGIITTRGFVGIPAEIFITDFKIPNLDSNKLKEPISKRGFSTTTLILPIKWALTPFPPFGSLTNLAVGFNASLTSKQVINLYYYPNIY